MQNALSIPARRAIIEQLERTQLPADAKVIVGKLMDTTLTVGTKVFEVGKHVIVFALDLLKRFRGIAFGVCIGLTVSFLVASTPLIGGALAAMLTPLLVAFGLTLGALEDVRNGALRDGVARFGADLEAAARG